MAHVQHPGPSLECQVLPDTGHTATEQHDSVSRSTSHSRHPEAILCLEPLGCLVVTGSRMQTMSDMSKSAKSCTAGASHASHRADGQPLCKETDFGTCRAKQERASHTCIGKSPCHAKKNDAYLCGLQYQSTMQDRIATVKAVIVLAACMHIAC